MIDLNEFVILHLSDFHSNSSEEDSAKRDEILEYLLDKIKTIFEDPKWKPSFVVVTGDIAAKPEDNNYKEGEKRFKKLIKLIESHEVKRNKIIIIPGNHDKNIFHEVSKNFITHEHINQNFDKKSIPTKIHKKYIDFVQSKLDEEKDFLDLSKSYFTEFDKSCARIGSSQPKIITQNKELEPHMTYTYGVHEFDDINNISFYTINTAIGALSGFADYGKLLIQSSSINKAKSYFDKKLEKNSNHVVFTLMHHPPSFLQEQNIYSSPNEVAIFNTVMNFSTMILCGHTHNNNMGAEPDLIGFLSPIMMSGASYKKPKEGYSAHWLSFNLIKIDLNNSIFTTKSIEYEERADMPVDENPWIDKGREKTWPLLINQTSLDYLCSCPRLITNIKELEHEVEYLLAQLYNEKKIIKG